MNYKNQGDILVFEKENGTAHFLTETHIKEFLDQSKCQLEFVFVASCHSEKTGKTFHRAGAKHVISIRQNEEISDQAQIEFSKVFYEIIFSQTKSICQAFKLAKNSIFCHEDESIRNEAHKFIIIRDIDDYD